MATAKRLLDRLSATTRHRAATSAGRFRMALSIGFVVATVGMATATVGRPGQAQDFLGALGSLFGAPPPAAPQYAAAPVYREVHRARRVRLTEDAPERPRRTAHHVSAALHDDGETPMRLGRASMCVRTCDGFAFPIGAFHGDGDIAAHEATCRSQCPGAPTALYVLPNGSSSIGEAVEARSGRAYSEKAAGFHYTTYLDESCSCHPQAGHRIASLFHDFTLRRGDAVVTAGGVKVFHGAGHFPFRGVDFQRLAQSRDVQRAARATFRDIERASLTSIHPAVTQAMRPISPAASLQPLEHQAALATP